MTQPAAQTASPQNRRAAATGCGLRLLPTEGAVCRHKLPTHTPTLCSHQSGERGGSCARASSFGRSRRSGYSPCFACRASRHQRTSCTSPPEVLRLAARPRCFNPWPLGALGGRLGRVPSYRDCTHGYMHHGTLTPRQPSVHLCFAAPFKCGEEIHTRGEVRCRVLFSCTRGGVFTG